MVPLLLIAFVIQADGADDLSSLLEKARPAHSKKIRLAALKKLGNVGHKDAKRTVASLAPYASDEDADIRVNAVYALAGSALNQLPCPMPTVKALSDRNENVRSAAATILEFKRYPKKALPLLFSAANSKDPIVRSASTSALKHAGGKTPKVLATLKRLFVDPDVLVRHNARVNYFLLTDDIAVHVTHLLRISRDRKNRAEPKSKADKQRRKTEELLAIIAAMKFYELDRTRPDELAKVLVKNLAHTDAAIRQCALRQLRAMCISSKSSFRAVDKLKPHKRLQEMDARDPNKDVQVWAWSLHRALKKGPRKDLPEKAKALELLAPPKPKR